MDDRVRLKVYYDGQILLQTSEGVKFVCENPLDIIIPFTLSYEELKGVICEKKDSQISRRVSCILYRFPISVFGRFVQFQTKYVTDEASMQEMFSVYLESRSRISFIELEEEFESNYEVVDPGVDEDQADEAMVADVADVANALANQQPFVEPSFMRSLDLETMHASEFPQYLPVMPDGEFTVGMEFSSREAVIKAMKDYTIRRDVDYREIRRYNVSYTCTRATISQDHSKLVSNTVAEAIKPLVEVDLSIKVKSVIVEVQANFNYTISYRKAWLAKQKVVESIFRGWEASYEALPILFEAMCHKEPSAVIHFEIMPAYQEMIWFLIFVYYTESSGIITLDGNNNIVPIAFAIVEGDTSEAWHFFLINLRQHVMTCNGVGLISDRQDSIRSAIARSNGAWSPPRAFHMFCIRHIESNFLRKFKASYLQKLIVNIGYSRTYALAFDGGYRWGHMTTNLVEYINSVLKRARNLPVTALVKATFYRLNELFTQKRVETEARINAGHVFSELVTSKLHANQRVAGNIQRLDWQLYVHDVYKMDQVR
ncbi:uncharacterized protein LOC107494518 [Arachis duranensis]|uniref:Uncharacterized protein LOC107494518 n=1 Tax=Arachis duranensis TaxID=130453 RepID=A0A6P4DU13_ARADU|nr:uncharacterized protein LOC107494518 [Arachis duranensis]